MGPFTIKETYRVCLRFYYRSLLTAFFVLFVIISPDDAADDAGQNGQININRKIHKLFGYKVNINIG